MVSLQSLPRDQMAVKLGPARHGAYASKNASNGVVRLRSMEDSSDAVRTAGVVGAGTMGCGIALCLADAGIDVALVDTEPGALARAEETLTTILDAQIARGRSTHDVAAQRLARIVYRTAFDALGTADIVVEAVFEDFAIKRSVFARLGKVCMPTALLGTNTSTLDVAAIGAAATHPERTLGMHFFSPAHVMKLLEVVRGEHTSAATIERAVALGKRLGKFPIVVGNCDGFVGNRMLLGYRREAEMLVLAGAPVARVDAVLERFGFAMGPFAVADLAGIDVGWRAKHERLKRGAIAPYALTNLPDVLVAAGRLGQKSGGGYYRYQAGSRARHAAPETDALIARERLRTHTVQRPIDDDEIVARCVYALVNEGARILAGGVAASPADIDAIWVNGYGFPRERGGPMRYAQTVGLAEVLTTIERFARDDIAFWRPGPELVSAAARGVF